MRHEALNPHEGLGNISDPKYLHFWAIPTTLKVLTRKLLAIRVAGRVLGLGLRVWGLGSKVWGVGFRTYWSRPRES